MQPDLTIPGHSEVFVIGDLAAAISHGQPVPGVAPAAKIVNVRVTAEDGRSDVFTVSEGIVAAVDALRLFTFVPFTGDLLIPMLLTFGGAGLFVGIVGSWTSIRKFMDV